MCGSARPVGRRVEGGEQRQRRRLRQPAHAPQGGAAVEAEAAHGIGLGQQYQRGAGEQAGEGGEVAVPARTAPQHLRPLLPKPPDQPQAQPQRRPVLQRAIPSARADVDAAHRDAVLARVAHDLRRGVEPHRLRIQQRAGEGRRVMAFQPGRDIHQMRETRRVALGKSVGAEALDLTEAALGEVARIAARHHAIDHLREESVNGADIAERRHGAAQRVGFLGREARRLDRDAHRLFLEQRHAERAAEHAFQLVGRAVFRRGRGEMHRAPCPCRRRR